jgi:hypothetical protein
MKILRFREGLATNSSSSHSILSGYSGWGDSHGDDMNYGWEQFLLKSAEEKARYVAAQIVSRYTTYDSNDGDKDIALGRMVQCFEAHPVTATFIPGLLEDWKAMEGDWNVDHQSSWCRPMSFDDPNEPDEELFFKICRSIIIDDKISIAGGNDNGGDLSEEMSKFTSKLYEYLLSGDVKARKNPGGSRTVLFRNYDKQRHAKVTLSFEGTGAAVDSVHYEVDSPELVDIKITDYCERNCAFCYQGSTINGKHASFEEIKKIADALSKAKVFEVAIGGGEPTSHPQFVEIVTYFKDKGIVPNYTTRMATEPFQKMFKELRYGYGERALSVDSLSEYTENKGHHGYFHIIPDLWPMEELEALLSNKQNHYYNCLIFLGLKTVGRMSGKKGGPKHDKQKIKEMIMNAVAPASDETEAFRIGVDTKFAQDYEVETWGISETLFYTQEGRYSMYIDAVTKTFGKSSFDESLIPYSNVSECLTTFNEWQKEYVNEV